jgi:hypothetical protein
MKCKTEEPNFKSQQRTMPVNHVSGRRIGYLRRFVSAQEFGISSSLPFARARGEVHLEHCTNGNYLPILATEYSSRKLDP